MKKILLVCAALSLPCFLLFSQEADEPGTGAELTIIPRLDLGAYGPVGKTEEKGGPTLGNSSIYTLFEGNITENLSFSVENHWASFGLTDRKWDGSNVTDLYKYTWRSDWTNWCDWAYLSYSLGNFWVNVGKDMVYLGGFEFDDYDFDVHPQMLSTLWNNFAPYQWQGAFGWTNESENTTLAAQISTSPYGERPFSSGIWNYSAKWVGEYGIFSNIWSFSAIGKGDGEYYPLVCLGQKISITDALAAGIDYWNAVCDGDGYLTKGHSAYASLWYSLGEKFDFQLKGGIEHARWYPGDEAGTQWNIGASAHWFPLRESRDLRVHAAFSRSTISGAYELTAGVMYYLNLHIGK